MIKQEEQPSGSIECSMLHHEDSTASNVDESKNSFNPNDLENGADITNNTLEKEDESPNPSAEDKNLGYDDYDFVYGDNDNVSMLTDVPGPCRITKWFAQQDGAMATSSSHVDHDNVDDTHVTNHMKNKKRKELKGKKESENHNSTSSDSVSAVENNKIIDNFMGADKEFVKGLQLERSKHLNENNEENKKHHHFESISYRLADSPLWHHFTHELRQRHRGKGNDKLQTFTKARKCLTLDYCKIKNGTTFNCSSSLRRKNKKSNMSSNNDNDEVISDDMSSINSNKYDGTSQSNLGEPINDVNKDVQFIIKIMIIMIGVVMSIVGFCISQASEKLLDVKIHYVTHNKYLVDHRNDIGFVFFLGCNLILACLAYVPILHRPYASGSGIAEAKAVLNGIVLPRATELRTALCKAISVIFTGAASLPAGLEGPMIFLGLAIGENAQKYFLPSSYVGPNTVILKSNRYKRDFAAIGAACGVTSAFFTPIGGVLFAMEEGSSFWSILLAWRSFSAACVTAICSYLLMYSLGYGHLINVASKFHVYPGDTPRPLPTFEPIDIIAFAIIGAVGGLIGACWNELNRMLNVARLTSKIRGPYAKCLEVLLITALSSALMWYLPSLYMQCTNIDSISTKGVDDFYRRFGCAEGEYNQLATLLLNPPSTVGINSLYWQESHAFTAVTCAIAGTIYLFILLLLFGTSIAMGIFVPFLFIGACYGRALALVSLFSVTHIDVTTYAMVGSVAVLAGVARIKISLTVIMITATGLPYLITPFMIATIFSVLCGNALFGRPGIYDIILQLKHIPFLEQEVPQNVFYRGLKAKDIMSTPVVSLQPELLVKDTIYYLETYKFDDFPVIDPKRDCAFIGVISRVILLQILSHKQFFYKKKSNQDDSITYKAFTFEYLQTHGQEQKNIPTIQKIKENITEDKDLLSFIDITPYINLTHYTFDRLGSAERAFEIFRTLGLRSLIVTGELEKRPLGVITRKDLYMLQEFGCDYKNTKSDAGKHEASKENFNEFENSFVFMS